ncbi:MAG: FAD-binding protein [Candidatus Methanofastidiosia archaeon]|jgi:fumarate reductase (CoM/CoB) subunit A
MNLKSFKTYDIIIIGGGGAGACAALSSTNENSNLKIALMDKGFFGKSGCTILGGFSCTAVLGINPQDSVYQHFEDTVREGRYINDQNLVEIYTAKAPDRVRALHAMGPVFEAEKGNLKQKMVPGHTYPRAVYNNLHTGRSMITALQKAVFQNNIDIYNEHITLKVICNKKVEGVLVFDIAHGELKLYACNAVIICTGGCGQLYKNSTTSMGSTGDGLALAYNAGAQMQDMEFIQFFPTAQCYPRLLHFNSTFPSMLRYTAGCRLYNKEGQEFMKKIPNWTYTVTRDDLSKAIYTEIKEKRGSPHGGVYMDVLHLSEKEIVDKFSFADIFNKLLRAGIDLRTDAIETTVAAHFSMGGIRVNTHFQTCVTGLFAAGEAMAGIHGANRLPGNALSEILVSGHEAGISAAHYAEKEKNKNENKKKKKPISLEVKNLLFFQYLSTVQKYKEDKTYKKDEKEPLYKNKVSPSKMKEKIQKIMWEHVGVIRNGTELQKAVDELTKIQAMLSSMIIHTPTQSWNKELIDAFEVECMVTVGLLVAKAALYRTESRGSHYRKDYPESDNTSWLTHIVHQKDAPMELVAPVMTKIPREEIK